MTEQWGFFERKTKDEQMRILVDSSWETRSPSESYTELLSVTINLLHMTSVHPARRELVHMLERIERRLEQSIAAGGHAVYVGRINTPRRLELYYYADAERFDREVLRRLEQELKPYRILTYSRPDPQWERYSFMLPSELEKALIHNAQMVYALIHRGDHIDRPRNVYHWLMFKRPDDCSAMKETAEQLGYRIEDARTPPVDRPEFPYALVISRWDNVRLETVNAQVRELLPLADELGGTYDGWGSMMRQSFLRKGYLGIQRMLRSVGLVRRRETNREM
ncbi:DUF695 domain-containing protein [Paenibacillus sp. IB182496]|uniref:DUF695 domain-containing protein n=1 Tax=Paenibacillus sabuli TaxID=2772509 RepID=A0A927BS27_9BACL|nr:DUF695 domain-containing protein [Paenibacillus sabuli]MBD2845742.1 DUF695 domain-containing protein [Paenibacillus sabuli]